MSGFILGGIPTMLMFGGTFFLGRYLCKLYDDKRTKNNVQNTDDKKEQITDTEEVNENN